MRFEWGTVTVKDKPYLTCPHLTGVDVYADNGERLGHGTIYDRTADKYYVQYAYTIHGLHSMSMSCLADVCKQHGLAESDYGRVDSNAYGVGRKYKDGPSCTLQDIKDMVEEAFCNSLQFDYEAELEAALKGLNERKALMDDARNYLEGKLKSEPEEEKEL